MSQYDPSVFKIVFIAAGFVFLATAFLMFFWVRRGVVEWRYAKRTGDWAPGWIIRCRKCGTSKSLTEIGWVRIGGYGRHYKWYRCPKCEQVGFAEVVRTSDPAFDRIKYPVPTEDRNPPI